MSSCLLFHGLGAKAAALAKASLIGTLLAPPFGEEGLKTDEARTIVSLLLNTPLGANTVGVVVIGPMDEANPKASDVLLKSIEEFRSDLVYPILWAHDLGGVSSTVRSRCLASWSRGSGLEVEEVLLQTGRDLVSAVLSEDYWRIAVIWGEGILKGKEEEILLVLSDLLAGDLENEVKRRLWEKLRKVTCHKKPIASEILAALVCP